MLLFFNFCFSQSWSLNLEKDILLCNRASAVIFFHRRELKQQVKIITFWVCWLPTIPNMFIVYLILCRSKAVVVLYSMFKLQRRESSSMIAVWVQIIWQSEPAIEFYHLYYLFFCNIFWFVMFKWSPLQQVLNTIFIWKCAKQSGDSFDSSFFSYSVNDSALRAGND